MGKKNKAKSKESGAIEKSVMDRIQKEIGEWSQKNFGDQKSNVAAINTSNDGLLPVPLGHLAPLLGIVEELGEFTTGRVREDHEEMRDALGDMFIYFCDFTYRSTADASLEIAYGHAEDVIMTLALTKGGYAYPMRHLAIMLGELCHVTLKTHQGIRKFKDINYASDQYHLAAGRFLGALCVACLSLEEKYEDEGFHPMTVLEETWNRVKQRDWKKNQDNAHEVAEAATVGFESAINSGVTD